MAVVCGVPRPTPRILLTRPSANQIWRAPCLNSVDSRNKCGNNFIFPLVTSEFSVADSKAVESPSRQDAASRRCEEAEAKCLQYTLAMFCWTGIYDLWLYGFDHRNDTRYDCSLLLLVVN